MKDHISILKKYFGFAAYRGQQQEIIERTLQGRSSLVIMPTGSGKSLTYQLPALLLEHLTIVISPLISLMKDQVDVLIKRSIDAAYINASLSKSEREKRYDNVSKGKYKLLYVTPERFRKREFIEILKVRQISLLAVDEAHCISEWGHDFRPDYTRIKEFRELMKNPPTIALTATATPDVQRDILNQLGLQSSRVKLFHEGIERPNLYLQVNNVWGEEEKLQHIIEVIKNNPGNGIVYFVLIRDLYNMSERLRQKKVKHLIYHGELAPEQRKKIQNKFMAGENNIVLATNAFGMGIDKENIRFVLHAQIPGSIEAYYQEIGRAGRDAKPALCKLLYDEQDLNIQLQFMKWNNPSADFYQRLFRLLYADIERVNAEGLEYLREQLSYKNKSDYRLETALGIFDRYGMTEGEVELKNLKLLSALHHNLENEGYLEKKLKREQEKLYKILMYTKETSCRKAFIHNYFGLDFKEPCGACDLDTRDVLMPLQ
jgi:ATP-dependent DNA helicase RecQ